METLLQLDSNLLLLLNYYHSDFWDFAFWTISSTLIWVPLYIMIVYAIVKGQKWQSWITLLAVVVLVFACDWISTDILKHGIQRFRPTHHPDLKGIVKTVFGYRGGSFGFVSSHAANTMGLAVFSSLVFKNRYYSIFILSWSFVVGYSRIYLGVHFPGDILGGYILGASLGYVVYKLYGRFLPKFVRLTYFNRKGLARGIAEQFDRAHVMQIVFVGLLTFVCVLIVSKVLLH
ncbi:phosphatase PAP2 family protein [Saccharicrinis fermentans]|uniref:Undecaprenyl pyrophosphate phosphatase n=1 Tax=Saccharicrinis fermentans DSM 9555 = JCM 21142 TaxID=869213 RepID=W7Y0F2_9BACT|nr:phosphatase PAP2 family protein [Saccharicrinis fermentans]GAF04390.1 undecaprenyl pyrophosphate phosphatase [Saccharicrinis fermentans DSM 9555 = JCM 21142]